MTALVRTVRMTAAESFWYVLGCIGFGAMYFAKVPVKKALEEAGLAHMTRPERFWYVLQCIGFGAGYFAKLPIKKALSEMAPAAPTHGHGNRQEYEQPRQLHPGYEAQEWGRGLPQGYLPELPARRRQARHGGTRCQGH